MQSGCTNFICGRDVGGVSIAVSDGDGGATGREGESTINWVRDGDGDGEGVTGLVRLSSSLSMIFERGDIVVVWRCFRLERECSLIDRSPWCTTLSWSLCVAMRDVGYLFS